MRKLAVLGVAGAALWLAPGALAAGWCGTAESATDSPDAVTGQQIHAIVVVPADGADHFPVIASNLANDVDSMVAWWMGQDPTRAPRFDQAVYPTGTCLDISFVRLQDSAASLQGSNVAFERVVGDLQGLGFDNPYKKYYIYYDGPAVQPNVCGTGGGDFSSGPAYSIMWLQGCPGVPNDGIGAHELVHALGALPAGAPHACPGDVGHPCDAPYVDLLSPYTDGRPLQQQVLDVNHDDYYGHSGSWDDIQDSLWLRHLEVPQVPLSVTVAGAGRVGSFIPGVDCTATCTTQWDGGSTVTLGAVPANGMRFVRWSGACTGSNTCSVALTQAQSVTAVFGLLNIRVKVTVSGHGVVRCSPACKRLYPAGDPLKLQAAAAKGWKFTGWTGGCKGARLVCRPSTEAPLVIRATFRRK